MAKTMAVVTVVSLREGQVTRATSWRTCRRNSSGLGLSMLFRWKAIYIAPPAADCQPFPRAWQEWRGSNPQPPVLETGALPIELHS